MPVLIDGYNLLRAVQKIIESETLTEPRLCRLLSDYFGLTGQKGQIVFDGTGERNKTAFENFSYLEVVFSGGQSDADTVIEEKITANSAPRDLLVVSSDRRLRASARKRKSQAIKSEEFWQVLADYFTKLSKKRKVAEPRGKFEGITDAETDYWLKIFGFKK